jgi:DMSO/TMAO reductase YedYZ heme-binding membrane subunit
VPTTVGRSRGRQGVHAGAQGAAGDHGRKITATAITAIVIIVAVLALTKVGQEIDAATQHFMLYYAGVLTLVGLTGSVLLGLVATDRVVMTPGHRVMAQAVHRAFSFGTLAFLVIHIVTEILAQRSHVLDGVVPFLSPYRTFYIGLGTIASDLIVLLVVTSILRKRFTAHGKAWRWRAIHYTAYVAFVFGVLHGLLGGRTAKPYVDWSYGFAIALTALGLAVRFLAISLRPKESLPPSPSVDRARPAGSSTMHTAAMRMAQAQLGSTVGATVQVLPAGLGGPGPGGPGFGGPGFAGPGFDGQRGTGPDTWAALPAPGRSAASGPFPALPPAPAHTGTPPAPAYTGAVPDVGLTPLGAPPYGDDPAGMRGRPYVSADWPPAPPGPVRQPRYEPGYDGPPRFEGAPRGHGDIPQDELSSYPYGPPGRRPPTGSPYPEDYPDRTGSGGSGGWPGSRADWPGGSGGVEPARPRAAIPAPPRPGDRNSGPMPQLGTGPMPRPDSGPMPRPDSGPLPRPDTGPLPGAGQGPPLRDATGPMPRAGTGPRPWADSGPMLRLGSGPMPRSDTGPLARAGHSAPSRSDSGAMPRPDTGPMPRAGQGPPLRDATGPMPRAGTGPRPWADSGPMPRLGTGPRPGTGPMPGPDPGSMPRPEGGPLPGPDAGAPSPWADVSAPRPDVGAPRPETGSMARHRKPMPAGDPVSRPRTGPSPQRATRPSRRAKSTDPRYRDVPGPTGGDEWQ